MKVLLVAKPWRGGLARYVYAALTELVPDSVKWLPTYPVSVTEKIAYRKDRTAWRRKLVRQVAESSCDAAIFINHLAEFEELARKDEYVLWITDDPRTVAGKTLPYARTYIADPGYQAEITEALGERFSGVLNFACLPSIHKSTQRTARTQGFCFIGNQDSKRSPYLQQLCSAGGDIRVYGNYFPLDPLCWRFPGRFRPSVSIERMAAIYARHLASINIHAKVVRGGTNMRTFECAGYCIAQIVERLPGLENLFEPDKDLLTFTNIEELREQMTRLEREPRLALSLASSATRRMRAEHTYFHRVRQLLEGLIEIPQDTVTRLSEKEPASVFSVPCARENPYSRANPTMHHARERC